MNWVQQLPISAQTVGLLLASNVFMTFAWYGHLKHQASSAWYVAALCMVGAVYFMFRSA